MSQIKLVAIDIDGTLLNSAGKITSRTKSTVQAVADLGIQIVISTGRRFSTAKEKVEPLEIQNLSFSCHNGIIFKQFNGQVLYHRLLDPQLARSIVAFAKSIGCYPIVFESLEDYTRIFVEPFTTEISSQPDPQTIAYLQESEPFTIFVDDLSQGLEGQIIEVICIIPSWQMADISQTFVDRFGSSIKTIIATVVDPSRGFFSVTNPEAGKSGPLQFIAQQIGINKSAILAIGDNYNDLEMLQYAGTGILMGNAHPDLQRMGFEPTATNDEDGLAQALEKHLLS